MNSDRFETFTRLSSLASLRRVLFAASLLAVIAGSANASVLTFEGFAPAGGAVNVTPTTPYREAGFTLTPADSNSAVFDTAAPPRLIGNLTSWLGFAAGSDITMTAGAPFSLFSLLIGPSTIGLGNIDVVLTGHSVGGGTLTAALSGLTAATLMSLNWNNLSDVTFSVTGDAGIDDISTSDVPEPGAWLLLGTGLLALRWKLPKRTGD